MSESNIVPLAKITNAKNLFFLQAKKGCPLSFNARFVYSFLVYRIGQAKGKTHPASVTIKQITNGTGLDKDCARAAIEELEYHGLCAWTVKKTVAYELDGKSGPVSVERQQGRVIALEGDSYDWFSERGIKRHAEWFDRFAYFKVSIPRSGTLASRHNALFWLIHRRPRQKQVWYARILGISKNTVGPAIETLRQKKYLLGFGLVTAATADYSIYDQKKPKREKQRVLSIPLENPSALKFEWFEGHEQFAAKVKDMGELMLQCGFTEKAVFEYWSWTIQKLGGRFDFLEIFVRDWHELFGHVEGVTGLNRQQGLFRGPNSGGLLKQETEMAIKVLECHLKNSGSVFLWSYAPSQE